MIGFLVCVPMLEEWKSGDGIEVLDGWTFQVYYFIRTKIEALYRVHSYSFHQSQYASPLK